MRRKAYLAGPDVFYDNAKEIARSQKLYCDKHNVIGLSPLDNEIPECKTKLETAQLIVEGNIQMINECDIVIANLANFRGTRDNPSCDSGTAWECGYAIGLNKPVLAYTDNSLSIPDHLRLSIDYCIIGNFIDALFFMSTFEVTSHPHDDIPEANGPICIDPKHPTIYDADAWGSFQLGYEYAKGNDVDYTLWDRRSLISKYGEVDRNGARFENFDMPVNIMIAVNHQLII